MAKHTIQIADDDFGLVQLLTTLCRKLDLEVFRSPDAMHALLGAHRVKPDLMLLDINMPSGNGLSICEFLAADSKFSGMPVIVMSGQSDDETIRRCRALSVHFVKKGPQLWAQLEPLIRRLLQADAAGEAGAADAAGESGEEEKSSQLPPQRDGAQPAAPKVLCIDDDPDVSKIIRLRLAQYGIDVHRAFKGMQGYWTAIDIRPDVIITDLTMPDGEGNYVYSRIRSHSLIKNTPVIVLTGQHNPALKRQMMSGGVDAFLTKPVAFDELLEHLRRHIVLPSRPLPLAATTVDCTSDIGTSSRSRVSPV